VGFKISIFLKRFFITLNTLLKNYVNFYLIKPIWGRKILIQISSRATWPRLQPRHAEYPPFSAGANYSPDTAGHMALKLMRITDSPGGSQSELLFLYYFLKFLSWVYPTRKIQKYDIGKYMDNIQSQHVSPSLPNSFSTHSWFIYISFLITHEHWDQITSGNQSINQSIGCPWLFCLASPGVWLHSYQWHSTF
jgi:hypothetical protein